MSPDQKAKLVELLQQFEGVEVGMCGDGANDCLALKQADIGLSLSQAEASIAAPFTSKVPNITPVIDLVKEGRCSLTTTIALFKYLELYSLVQFSSLLILYMRGLDLGDWQYVQIDLILTTPLFIFMSSAAPVQNLNTFLPYHELVCFPVLFSVLSHFACQLLFQVAAFFLVQSFDFFQIPDYSDLSSKAISKNYLSTAVFLQSVFMYLIYCFVFNMNDSFREPLIKNKWLTLFLVLGLGQCVYLLFTEQEWVMRYFKLKETSFAFKGTIMALACGQLAIAVMLENKIPTFTRLWKRRTCSLRSAKEERQRLI